MTRLVDGAEIDEWIYRVGESLKTLGGFRGMWIHGSAASGDWVAGVSDIDLLVLWANPLTDERPIVTEAIRDGLMGCPIANADVHVVTLAVAANPADVPRYELYGGIHSTDSGGPVLTGPSNDTSLLFDLESTRARGIAVIAGEFSAPVIGDIPLLQLLTSADGELAEWEAYSYFRHPHMAVLQASRAWMLAAEGTLGSKLAAGRWALVRWREPELLSAAIARQLGNVEVIVEEAEARALLAHARAAVRSRLADPNWDTTRSAAGFFSPPPSGRHEFRSGSSPQNG